jgi:Spy/CpxP family protein refolding chaperone
MKKLLKIATVAVALTMVASAAAEAQGGGGGGGGGGGAGGQRGGGRGGRANAIVADGVSADSAYNLLFAGITLEPAKKAPIVALIPKFQADLKATPAPARGGGARGGGGTPPDSATLAANAVINAKRATIINAFRTEAKKQLTPEQATVFDMNLPDPTAARRGGGGGGGSPSL